MLINTLKGTTRIQAIYEYEQNKHNRNNGYICRWFGFYRIYTGQTGLFILFLITLMFGVGIIRRFIDAFQVNNFVNKKNKELDLSIYNQYK